EGLFCGSAEYAVKCSGFPVSGENATALGNSLFKWASGLGLVKIRSAAPSTTPLARIDKEKARDRFNRSSASHEIIPVAARAVKVRKPTAHLNSDLCIENFPHFFEQPLRCERLLHEVLAPFEPAGTDDLVVGITRHIKDAQGRVDGRELLEECRPMGARHHHV